MHSSQRDHKLSELIEKARSAKNGAIALYSHFRVGAALESRSGRIYSGVNIESSSYGLTMCAERVALFKALSEGERDFARLAVATDTAEFCSPCGACRQVLWDFAPDIEIYLVNRAGQVEKHVLRELIPSAFDHRLLKATRDDAGKK